MHWNRFHSRPACVFIVTQPTNCGFSRCIALLRFAGIPSQRSRDHVKNHPALLPRLLSPDSNPSAQPERFPAGHSVKEGVPETGGILQRERTFRTHESRGAQSSRNGWYCGFSSVLFCAFVYKLFSTKKRIQSTQRRAARAVLYRFRQGIIPVTLCLEGTYKTTRYSETSRNKTMDTSHTDVETASGFEGAEKILQIKIASVKPNSGLRAIPRSTWQTILNEAKCTILSQCESE